MKRSIIFYLLILIGFLNTSVLHGLDDYPSPKIKWELKSDDKTWYLRVYNQSNDDNEFLTFKNEFMEETIKTGRSKRQKSKVSMVTLDSKTGREKASLKLIDENKTIDEGIKGVYKIGDYVLKFFSGIVIVYNDKTLNRLCTIYTGAEKYSYFFMLTKKIIIIDKHISEEDKDVMTFYNIETGREVFSIKYSYGGVPGYSFGDKGYQLFEDLDVIAIYENRTDLSLFSLLDGSKIGTIKDCVEGEYYTIFDSKIPEEKYFVTSEPHVLRLINLKTGELKSEIEFAKNNISDIGFTLNEIDDYVYLTFQDEVIVRDNGLVCLDIKNQKIVWEKDLATSNLLDIIDVDNDLITFDDKYLYRLDKKTGKEVWKSELRYIKNIRREKNGILIGFGLRKIKNLAQELGFTGFALIDENDGSVKWKFNADRNDIISNVTYNNTDENIYFCTNKKFYILNPENGKVVKEKVLKLIEDATSTEDITSTILLKDKNQMLLFSEDTIYLYDLNSEKMKYSVNINKKFFKYIVYEVKVIGDYLIYTGVTPARHGFVDVIGSCIRTVVNIKNGEVLWQYKIGMNYYIDNVGLIYYIKYGMNPVPPSITRPMFRPRKEVYQDNLLILHDSTKSNSLSTYSKYSRISCFEIFPEDNIPSEDDIKSMIVTMGVRKEVLTSGYLKREIAGYNKLWDK